MFFFIITYLIFRVRILKNSSRKHRRMHDKIRNILTTERAIILMLWDRLSFRYMTLTLMILHKQSIEE